MSEDNTITIDLTKSINAHDFGAGHIIHKAEFDSIVQEVTKRIRALPNLDKTKPTCGKNEPLIHHHDAFTIYGTRGSGKTSFLYSLRAEFTEGEKCKDLKLCVLPLVDPTLIEEKGHIFLTIISLIDDVVENKLNECCGSNTNEKKEWKKKMRKLAAGLPSINDNNDPINDWSDAEHVMNQGLTRVKSAFNLARHFHELVEYALVLLKQNAFVLMLDDIDINFAKGWPTLETIRKYLTTPRILTFVSGDLQLFSTAIRKKQWENFGDNLLTNEGERLKRIDRYNEQVNEMESQYLQKVLKPPYRTYLKTLGAILQFSPLYQIEICACKNTAPVHIDKFFNTFFLQLGLRNINAQKIFKNFIVNLPLRSLIFFMQSLIEKRDNIHNLTHIFVSFGHEYNLNTSNLISNSKLFIPKTLDILIKHDILANYAHFLPSSTNQARNSILAAIGIIFHYLSRYNSSVIFDYLLFIGNLSISASSMGKRRLQQLVQYSTLLGTGSSSKTAMCYIIAYSASTSTNTSHSLRIKGLAIKSKPSFEEKKRRIDYILETISYPQRMLASLPLSLSTFHSKQQSITNYSIYNLLASISELIKSSESIFADKDNKYSDLDISHVKLQITELSTIKSYSIPHPEAQFYEQTENIELEFPPPDRKYDSLILDEPKNDFDNAFIEHLINWCKSFNVNQIHPYFLYKISIRLNRALFQMMDKLPSDTKGTPTLAEIFERQIIILFNTCLAEEVKENVKFDFELNNNNPTESSNLFIQNLEKVKNYLILKNYKIHDKNDYQHFEKELPLTNWILNCPLLLIFLRAYDRIGEKNAKIELINHINSMDFFRKRYEILDTADHKKLYEIVEAERAHLKKSGTKLDLNPKIENRLNQLNTLYSKYDEYTHYRRHLNSDYTNFDLITVYELNIYSELNKVELITSHKNDIDSEHQQIDIVENSLVNSTPNTAKQKKQSQTNKKPPLRSTGVAFDLAIKILKDNNVNIKELCELEYELQKNILKNYFSEVEIHNITRFIKACIKYLNNNL